MATIKVTDESECVAWFKKKKFTVTTSVDPAGSGMITGAGTYDKGTIVTVEAVPAEDYEFDRFTINGEEEPADPEG